MLSIAVYSLTFFPRDDQMAVGSDDESDKIRTENTEAASKFTGKHPGAY